MGTQNFYLNNLNKFKKEITILTLYNKLSTTSTQQNENMAAIGSRPIRAHHSSHVHASFLYGTELRCIRCKKLVHEKSCTRNHVRRSSFLYKSSCTSFLTVCHHHYKTWLTVSEDAAFCCLSTAASRSRCSSVSRSLRSVSRARHFARLSVASLASSSALLSRNFSSANSFEVAAVFCQRQTNTNYS